MSVINKMLKDLEQREQKPGADFDSNNASAVYQPKERNNLALVLGLMFVVILLLAGAVSWLLFKNTEQVPVTAEQVVVEKEVEAEAVIVATQKAEVTKPEPTVIKRSPVYVPADAAQSIVSAQVVPSKDEQKLEPQVNRNEGSNNETAIDAFEQPNLNTDSNVALEEKESSRNVDEPVDNVQFTIEKTPSHLTREQRIEKLMAKANSSFDKGYITDAITQLEEVLNSADDHVEARNLLAVAWYGRGELQQAVSILNNGLNRYPNVEMWRLTAAKIFFKENELPGAFSYLEADLANASSEYYSMKGTLARQLKRFDKAETAYASLTKLEPNKGSWWLGHAIALDSQNKSELAINSYKQAITHAGISPTSMKFAQQRIESLQE